MRGWSLRTWLLVVSIAFAAVVVGGIALVSYVIVSGGMSFVANDRTMTRAETAKGLIDREYYEAYQSARARGADRQGGHRTAPSSLWPTSSTSAPRRPS